jgi:hypothetical protein
MNTSSGIPAKIPYKKTSNIKISGRQKWLRSQKEKVRKEKSEKLTGESTIFQQRKKKTSTFTNH